MTFASVIDHLRTPAAFLFVLGILIFVHELGHFLVARWYGVRVVTFSLGFGPKILKYSRGGTEYCISVVPLGGYVKLAGETVEEDRTGAPDEFLSKSKWIRFQVYLAGPAMNLLLAWVVLAGVLSQGADVALADSAPPIIGAVEAGGPAAKAGLQVGDRFVRAAGRPVKTWEALNIEILQKANQQIEVVVERNGGQVKAALTPTPVSEFDLGVIGVRPIIRPQISLVAPGGPAERAGLKTGDVVVGIGEDTKPDYDGVINRLRAGAGKTIAFKVERDGQTLDVPVVPELDGGVGVIGIRLSSFETKHVHPTLPQAFKLSAQQNWETTVLIVRTLKGLFTRETPMKSLMGPIMIAKASGSAAKLGWLSLFGLIANISLNLALINLLIPVPILDGGQIVILAAEGLARRDLGAKVKERILIAGAVLIIALMVTVIYNDVVRLLR